MILMYGWFLSFFLGFLKMVKLLVILFIIWLVFIFRCRYLRLNYRLRLFSTCIVYSNVNVSNKKNRLLHYNYSVVNFLFKTCALSKSWSHVNSIFCKPISHFLFISSLAPVKFSPKCP